MTSKDLVGRLRTVEASMKDLAERFMMASRRMSQPTGKADLDTYRDGLREAYFECAKAVEAALRPLPQEAQKDGLFSCGKCADQTWAPTALPAGPCIRCGAYDWRSVSLRLSEPLRAAITKAEGR
jgi:hypothetical protein